jgi:hypothetical protein
MRLGCPHVRTGLRQGLFNLVEICTHDSVLFVRLHLSVPPLCAAAAGRVMR